ncbi:hypothetical protein G9A89_018644 [Geosiphon pyriformis]|nr:hypothetical protein G9A89_018644 [Geosiphon pyriformis]
MALLGSLFQLLPGCIGLKSVSQDAVKLFCVKFASQKSLNGATKVAISDEVFLTTLKIVWFSGVVSVFSPSLSVALCDVPLGTSSDDIKTALGIFGVVTSVKLKPADLWQYAVVNFKDISSAAAALSNWSVLVRKDSVRIFPIANQKEVISSRDAFNAKLVNLPFGCTVFEISDLVSQVGGHTCFIPRSFEFYQHQCFAVVTFDSLESLNVAVSKTSTLHGCHIWCQDLSYLAVDCKKLPPLLPKLPSNSIGGPKNFKSSFIGSKFYAKAAAFVVSSGAAADMDLNLGGSPKTTVMIVIINLINDLTIDLIIDLIIDLVLVTLTHNTTIPMLSAVLFVPNTAVESRLASLEFHFSELSVLIKFLVESVSALVALVTKLLFTPFAVNVLVKKCVDGLAKQNKNLVAIASIMQKRMIRLEKIYEQIYSENRSDVDDMIDNVNDDDDEDKDFSVYNNTFNIMMHLWEEQSSRIKSSSDQTAKWMSGIIKNSYELVSIMGKMYELDMFDTLSNKDSTSM